ncbi:MAG: serine hydroxymethyltransferase, partial [Patescibacteria group bacterium]|nr:serine hydroxymethyltransferase [Patescibacteria group bacterium]
MINLKKTDQEIFELIKAEEKRQLEGLELIASENYASLAVREAMGSILTNKYSEGYPGKRYYAGNQNIDAIENLAISRAKKLFSAEYVNIQPLSGSPANLAAYFALLKPSDKIMALSLDQGGHLTHGHPLNLSGKLFKIVPYFVDKKTEMINMHGVEKIAVKEKPQLILAGFTAYPRKIDWHSFRNIANKVGAILMADISHTAGLIAGKALENPVPICDVVVTTTHKTLRGPRGAIIMSKEKFAKPIARSVFPGLQGGPHNHINAAKAVCFKEVLRSSFKKYASQVITNAKILAEELKKLGFRLVTGGTDTHLILIDLSTKNITGQEAENILERAGFSTNKNMIPYDRRKPLDPSGLRIGTAAATTRGMKEKEMIQIAKWINKIIENKDNKDAINNIKKETIK